MDQSAIEKLSASAVAFAGDPLGVGLDVTMQSAAPMIAMMTAALLTRVAGGGTGAIMASGGGTSAALETGNRYAEKITAGMAHEQAWTEATVEGGIVGAFDAASLGSAGRAVGTIARASLGGKLATGLKEVGKQAALGAGGEANAAWSSGHAAEPASMMAEAIGEVFGAIPGGLIAAPRAVGEAHGRVMQRVAEAEQARETAANLAELHTVAQESKTQGRDREAFQAFAAELAKNGQVSDLYIDPKDFVEYFQSRGIDPAQVAETMPSVRDQFDESMATQAPLRIPLAEYTAQLATDAVNDGLIPFMRVSDSGMHAAEAEQLMAEYEQIVQQEEAKALDDVQVQAENEAQVQAVRDRLTEQLSASGRVTPQVARDSAKLAGEFYRTVGAKMGMSPEQFADTFALNVTGARVDAEGWVRFEQGAKTSKAGEEANNQTTINSVDFNSSSVANPIAGKASQTASSDIQSVNSMLDLAGAASASSPAVKPNAVGLAPQNDEARSFANTERTYGGREAYNKANAEGRTKLNYQQWVQVRMPEFKAWFGDWEGSSTLIEPVRLELSGWSGSASELSRLAREVYTQELQGSTVNNASIDAEIVFSSEGKGEAFGARGKLRNPVRAEMVRVLRDVVGRAVKVAEALPEKGRDKDTKAFHTLVAPIAVGDGIYSAKITVREALESNASPAHKFYDVTSIQIERSPDVHGLNAGLASRPAPFEASGIKLSELAKAHKIDVANDLSGVSKVIDQDTGEPLVVYHGTNADFNEFKTNDGMFGHGAYFAKQSEYADGFADDEGGNVLPVFLKLTGNGDGRILSDKRGGIYVVASPTQIKSATGNTGAFSPNNPNILMQGAEDARGFIRFDPAGITNAPSLIALLEKADNSTFLHELGHYFFEVYNHLATLPDTPAEVKSDMAALVKFAGIESVETWQAMTPEERRPGHEKVADAFEQYLFEGKAPSLELHGVFHMFDTRLYRPAIKT